MDAWAPISLVLLIGLLAASLVYHLHQQKIERRRQLHALASDHGLEYSLDDPFGTLGEPFSLLRRGDGRGVENVLWGVWQGHEVRAFDYWYYEETSDPKGHTSRTYFRFECVMTPVEASCPPLQISEENLFTRLADALSFRDIEFESQEFNRRFTVKGPDEHFATAFCDARMMTWLLRHGDGYAFEILGDRLLCWCRRIAPTELVRLLGTATTFRDRIPAVVSSLYPRG